MMSSFQVFELHSSKHVESSSSHYWFAPCRKRKCFRESGGVIQLLSWCGSHRNDVIVPVEFLVSGDSQKGENRLANTVRWSWSLSSICMVEMLRFSRPPFLNGILLCCQTENPWHCDGRVWDVALPELYFSANVMQLLNYSMGQLSLFRKTTQCLLGKPCNVNYSLHSSPCLVPRHTIFSINPFFYNICPTLAPP